MKHLSCTKDCTSYSFPLKRCSLGKINPRIKKQVLAGVAIFGWDYICSKNLWKKKEMEGKS